MGKTRKKTVKGGRSQSDSETAEAVNANDNCQVATVSRKHDLNVNEDQTKLNARKVNKVGRPKKNWSVDAEVATSQNEEIERAQFDEEQDTIEIEVQHAKDDFLSDGEVDSEYKADQDESILDRSRASE